MASHVVVIDSSARRATVKVTPQTYLSDVLAQACSKLGLRSELYGLKYNKKQVDISLTFRLANLPSGAQLELVQSSKSPSVVNVALQFPQSENNLRLTEKFPSSTSLWQVLRRFESGTAGGAPYPLNITQRGIAERNSGAYGAGRMFYEMPALSLMNREFATFVDLQKTLAGVGVASGSALFRLNFRHSGKPLEEAMAEISEYFKETEEAAPAASTQAAVPPKAKATDSKTEQESPDSNEAPRTQTQPAPEAKAEPMEDVQPSTTPPSLQQEKADPPTTTTPAATTSQQPRITTFLAPSTDTPTPAIRHNEDDYIPTVDHAKTHQARLESAGKNQRLLSDAELDAQRREREDKVKAVQSVTVRFRMPDQYQIQTVYSRGDTAQALWATMGEVLRYSEVLEGGGVVLSYRDGASGKMVVLGRGEKRELIGGLGWTGNTLVNVSWALEEVDEKVKGEPSLKDEYLKTAVKREVEEPKDDEPEEKKGGFLGGILGAGASKDKGKSKLSAGEKEAKLGKLLGFGKKK